jgi:chromosome segregation ATPase
MTKRPDAPEIVNAASAIERDLARLEELSRSVEKMKLTNEKSIDRARRTLQDALAQQEALATGLRVLGEAMVHMQQRQQVAVERLAARAVEIQNQAARVSDHMTRFAELGSKAAEATRMLQELPAPYGSGEASQAQSSDPPVQLVKIEELLGALADECKALTSSADIAELEEISREAHSLRQRLESARARISSLLRARQQAN